MNAPKTLMITGAHPDDETLGVGATLAQYAAAGYKVYYICGTYGEAGDVAPEFMQGYSSIAELRTHELECAAAVLGLTKVFYLGYRDSGMPGTEDNKHPNALIGAPPEEVAGRIVENIRRLKPEVIITSDPNGGYGHPDHIAIHQATVMAFSAAGDPQKYPKAGPPFQPKKLYCHVFSHRFLKFSVQVAKLLGKDVHHMGRNKDIDFASFVEREFPIHCIVRLSRRAVETRDYAVSCHASQIGGGGFRRQWFVRLTNRIFGQRDCFMRLVPPVIGKIREKDLFQDIK